MRPGSELPGGEDGPSGGDGRRAEVGGADISRRAVPGGEPPGEPGEACSDPGGDFGAFAAGARRLLV